MIIFYGQETMFLYQTRRLKSEVCKGILEAQYRMVTLYTQNLGSLGAKAAFVATLTYSGIQNALIVPIPSATNYAWLFNISFAISLSASLIIVTHCVLASMLGPTKALVGKQSDIAL